MIVSVRIDFMVIFFINEKPSSPPVIPDQDPSTKQWNGIITNTMSSNIVQTFKIRTYTLNDL